MLSSPGIGSGLDVNGIVSQLMAIERQPLAALDNKEAKQQTRLTAFGSLKGALSTFQSSLSALSDPAKFTGVTANFADATLANVSATSSAAVGSHSVEIQTLAQSHKLKSANFATTSATLGSGTLTYNLAHTVVAHLRLIQIKLHNQLLFLPIIHHWQGFVTQLIRPTQE